MSEEHNGTPIPRWPSTDIGAWSPRIELWARYFGRLPERRMMFACATHNDVAPYTPEMRLASKLPHCKQLLPHLLLSPAENQHCDRRVAMKVSQDDDSRHQLAGGLKTIGTAATVA